MICKECRHPWELHRNCVGCLDEGCTCGVDADESAHAWERTMGDVMRKAHEYLDGKRTRGEDSIIRDLLSAVEKVLELCDEADTRNPKFFGFLVTPDVRKAIQEALGGVNHD